MPLGVPQALLEVSPEVKLSSGKKVNQNVFLTLSILSHTPVLNAGVADIVRPELEGVAASARDAAKGVAGEGVVAPVLVGVKLKSNGICEGSRITSKLCELYFTKPPSP